MRFRTLFLALAASTTALACDSDSTTQVQSTTFRATLNGANEVPARTTPATGIATYVLTGNMLTFSVSVTGLTAPVTGAHIHVGAAGVNGGIVVPYTIQPVQTGIVTSGTIDLSLPVMNGATSITGDSLKALFNNGNAYTNVHTSAFPGGEVRGQIIKQ